MIALLLATLDEAQPLLALLKAEKLLSEPFETYGFPAREGRAAGLVVISGMGLEQAAAAARYAITARGAKRLINLGICGALAETGELGRLYRITEVTDGDALQSGRPDRSLSLSADGAGRSLRPARLVSLPAPVFDGARKKHLAAHAELVDMEGFAIAETCLRSNIPCELLKGVSDQADAAGRGDLHRNLQTVSSALAEQVVAGLDRPSQPGSGPVAKVANLVKVEHTIFSLPLLFAGAWLAAGGRWPGLRLLALIALAGLGARTLGMAMNRILDRRLDWLNPRTAGRELPSGRMTQAQGWGVAAAGLAVYLAACAALGPACWRLSPIPAAVLISYSLLKRFTSLCHFGIGVCLAMGPLGAWVAVTGATAFSAAVLMLALFTFCWISGFDVIYSLQDLATDRETGVHSLPAALGGGGAQAVAAIVHLIAIAASARLWWLVGGGAASGVAFAVTVFSFGLAYFPKLPLHVRFFPVSAIAGIAGSLIPLLGGIR